MFHWRGSGKRAGVTTGTTKPSPGPKDRFRCVFEKGEEFGFRYVYILERLTALCRNNEWEVPSIRRTLCDLTNLLGLNLGFVRQGQVTF